MGPETFFILFLLAVALVGGAVVLFYALKPKPKKTSDVITEEVIKDYFEDTPLQDVLQKLKARLKEKYRCGKCGGKRYDAKSFDEDLYEIYCLECGYKSFYNVDLLAGFNRSSKKTKSRFPKVFLKNASDATCSECHGREFVDFKVDMDVRYKFSGYGDTKSVTLYLNSCKSCGLINFYDRARR